MGDGPSQCALLIMADLAICRIRWLERGLNVRSYVIPQPIPSLQSPATRDRGMTVARIAYVDHSYHRTTHSTMFLPEMLRAHGHEVDIFWDDAWIGGVAVEWERVATHDVVIMFQSFCPIDDATFRSRHPNVV